MPRFVLPTASEARDVEMSRRARLAEGYAVLAQRAREKRIRGEKLDDRELRALAWSALRETGSYSAAEDLLEVEVRATRGGK